ncbi:MULTISPECIES: major outer membrane lipoprotein [Providencia]|jgi:murein lipoprotein|uniref:Major outer membrane lipoprotein Lpp n=11 Tax=Providencia TaxID=586 RepID=A0A1B7K207_9GAMM|nr:MULTISPECIES: major outer membrane lipoprotein [Providencia]ELR5072537.1 major outer membrane lipoprotein [Providencia stuartii]MBC8653794.1 major outer membrane lipoprotein [Providencia vermicola]MRF66326.1 major outer membrane lipoprotein [Escherichia coli]MTC75436.1 major outer membrane lipoprotein [Providencia sp. wls1919]APC11624.1 Major outer membrane lipoprotein Lpp precursor [Providencia rettgeri]
MIRTKIVLGSIVLASALLAGCSNSTEVQKLSSDVQTLNGKVDQLSNDVQSLRSDVQTAQEEAARANQRLDNQVRTYKK